MNTRTAATTLDLTIDRIVMTVDTYAEQARRSATVRTRGEWRQRQIRRTRQVRFNRAWGL